MSRALILGGTGAIGRATAHRLLDAGWQVDLTGRDPAHLPAALAAAGARFAVSDRGDPGQLAAILGDGADLLVDCVCFTAADATALLALARAADSTVLISSKAVYVDEAGHHSNSAVRPDFGGPVRETQPTPDPGAGTTRLRRATGRTRSRPSSCWTAACRSACCARPRSTARGPGSPGSGGSSSGCWTAGPWSSSRTAVRAWTIRPRPPTSRRSSRWPRPARGSESSTAPTRTHRAGWRSPGPSPGTSAMTGTRCCSATTPRPGWADIPGTRGRRSCWT